MKSYVITAGPFGLVARRTVTSRRAAIALVHKLARDYGTALNNIYVEYVDGNAVTVIYRYCRSTAGDGTYWYSGPVYASSFSLDAANT